ncbi:hypothetical protein P9112_001050 [Eukaryota sp. TZLM1-RC]
MVLVSLLKTPLLPLTLFLRLCPKRLVVSMTTEPRNFNKIVIALVIAFINDFISSAYNDRISQDFKCDPNNPREVALTNEIARLTQLTVAHRACTLRATHLPNYISLNQRYDEPAHKWDIFRAGVEINPAGISSCVDTDVISTLAEAADGTRPGLHLHHINDEELWENILFASQFPNLATAKLTLSQVKMDWNISNYQSRWIKYISQVGFVVNQSMGMRDTLAIDRFQPHQEVIKLEEWDIAFSILDNLGIDPLFNELFNPWTYSSFYVKRRLSDFIDVLSKFYNNWCNTRTFEEQKRARKSVRNFTGPGAQGPMFGGRPHPQDQKLIDIYDYVEQVSTNKEQLRRRVKNLKKRSAKDDKSAASPSDIYGFCKEPGHSVKECLHPHCKRSAIPKNKRRSLDSYSSSDSKRSRSYRINTINIKNPQSTNVNPSSDHTTDSLKQSFFDIVAFSSQTPLKSFEHM